MAGVSGEQFALPEAIGLLRSIRNQERARPSNDLIAISGADPLNLSGILAPGLRVAAVAAHRILLRGGVQIAALKAGQVISLEAEPHEPDRKAEQTLRIGTLSPALRPYYA